ncbi:hypothetical protein [Natrinema ejinorense]|uniref:hypothetical protein n=1 Tax=Natrinema ejinorense TaxID=373386 RepID=UPI001FE4CB41|nr:hypothetical protein [Natrinema ejinorense]
MRRVASKATKTVKKKVSPVLRPLAAALIFAVVVTAVAVVTGLVDYVPESTVPVTDWVLSPRVVLLITVFVLAVVVIGVRLLYLQYKDAIADQWDQLSIWAQATIAGAVCGLLVATGLGIATLVGVVSPVSVLAGSLIAWPVATVLTLRQRREPDTDDSPSALRSVLIRTGYAQVKHLQTRTLAGIVGFVGAVLASVGTRALVSWLPWFDGTLTQLQTVVLAAVLWLIATVLVYNRYESTISDRTDLRIVAVSRLESRDGRELMVKNTGITPVELTQAKIRDTKHDLYQFDVGVTLEPGERCSFELPATFLLESNEAAMDLPLGYTLKQGGEHPIVYTRTGDQFVLQGSSDALDRESVRAGTRSTIGIGAEPTPQE